MSEKPTDLIKKAGPILVQAVNFDNDRKYNDALPKYIEGITLLANALRDIPKNDPMAVKILENQRKYTERAELLKSKCKFQVDFFEQRRIEADSTGHGYERIFGKCCDDRLKWVDVEDAYIVKHHQVMNFLRFCELLVEKSRNLRTITLKTGKDAEANREWFAELAGSLQKRQIALLVEYRTTIHDREITFDNGWCVKIGRGLDYFKPIGKFSLGACDMNQRPCHETTIDIFKRKMV